MHTNMAIATCISDIRAVDSEEGMAPAQKQRARRREKKSRPKLTSSIPTTQRANDPASDDRSSIRDAIRSARSERSSSLRYASNRMIQAAFHVMSEQYDLTQCVTQSQSQRPAHHTIPRTHARTRPSLAHPSSSPHCSLPSPPFPFPPSFPPSLLLLPSLAERTRPRSAHK